MGREKVGCVVREKAKLVLCYVARHGTTILNSQNCFRGRNDVPLDAQGKRDANKLAFYFEPIEVSHIFSSDRKRAEETADAIGQRKGMEVYATKALRAWNVGSFSGKEKTDETVAEFEQYVRNPDMKVPDGESLKEFKNRVRPAIMEAVELGNAGGVPVLLVAHSSVIHEISSMFHGHHEACLVEPGGAIEIFKTENGVSSGAIFKPKKDAPTSGADTVS